MHTILRATALCLRQFDVGEAIDLEACRARLTQGSRRLALRRGGSEYVELSNPPLKVELGQRTLEVLGQPQVVELGASFFAEGVVSLQVRVALPAGATFAALTPLADELLESPKVAALCTLELKALLEQLGPAVERPHLWGTVEAYTVLCVRELAGAPTAEAVLADPGLPALLIGETQVAVLSAGERAEVLRRAFSYGERDLVVIEWSAALVYEPGESEDVIDLLEVANAQLLELRYYDAALDRELGRAYEAVRQRRGPGLFRSPYSRLLRELMPPLIELSQFVERVENALKIVGDVYLARVYEAAVEQLRLKQWSEQVARKQRLLQQTYALLKGEVDTQRSLTLEVMIVILIALEIVMALFKVTGA